MNKYNEHVKESIDYFNHELECMKHRVCNCDMQTSLRVGREKTAYETAVECLKKQLPQPPVKATHRSIIHENRGDQPHAWIESHCELWECPCCGKTVWSGISIDKKKCDKCDKYRKIEVTLPSGNVVDDDCKCGERKKTYQPKENLLYMLSDTSGKITGWYKEIADGYFDTVGRSAYVIVDHNKDFKELEENLWHTFFTTKEECQEFCDYMNRKEENSGYNYDLAGKLIKAREV